ncbi:MAG: hypothetical protein RLY66_23 [Candidatus Parcubacteria bacterium]
MTAGFRRFFYLGMLFQRCNNLILVTFKITFVARDLFIREDPDMRMGNFVANHFA